MCHLSLSSGKTCPESAELQSWTHSSHDEWSWKLFHPMSLSSALVKWVGSPSPLPRAIEMMR